MYIIYLDDNYYLQTNDSTWCYVDRKQATKFPTYDAAQVFMNANGITFIAPDAMIESL